MVPWVPDVQTRCRKNRQKDLFTELFQRFLSLPQRLEPSVALERLERLEPAPPLVERLELFERVLIRPNHGTECNAGMIGKDGTDRP